MSDRKSLYHFVSCEVLPPPEVWAFIDKTLDCDKIDKALLKLDYLEIFPPGAVWKQLSDKLDVSQKSLQYNSSHFSVKEDKSSIAKVIPMLPAQKKWTKRVFPGVVAASVLGVAFCLFVYTYDKVSKKVAATIPAVWKSESESLAHANTYTFATADFATKTTAVSDDAQLSGRYIMAVSYNGNWVQISPKLIKDLKVFFQRTGDMPYAHMLQQLRKWQVFVIGTDLHPVTVNFTNPIELCCFLQDKK